MQENENEGKVHGRLNASWKISSLAVNINMNCHRKRLQDEALSCRMNLLWGVTSLQLLYERNDHPNHFQEDIDRELERNISFSCTFLSLSFFVFLGDEE